MTRTFVTPNALFTVAAAAALLFFANACHRDKTVEPPAGAFCLLSRLDTDTLVTDYFYDAQNRVVRMESQNGWHTTFLYGAGQIVGMIYNPAGTLADHILCGVNAEGNVTSVEELNGDQYEIGYNSDGYLESLTEVYANGGFYTEAYVIIDGNVLSVRREDNRGTVSLWVFEYDAEKANKGGYFHAYNKSLYGFTVVPVPIGKASKNLATRMTYFVDGALVSVTDYAYEFTPEGYVSKVITGAGPLEQATFEYDCR